jgi:hypothetical protein
VIPEANQFQQQLRDLLLRESGYHAPANCKARKRVYGLAAG